MTIKASKLLLIFIFGIIICLTVMVGINTSAVAYASDNIIITQNTDVVTYSSTSYVNNFGELHNFSTVSGQFVNALYNGLDIKINDVMVSVDNDDIIITNQTDIKAPKTYSLNVRLSYGGEEYTVTGIPFVVSEKTLEINPEVEQSVAVLYNGTTYMNTSGVLSNLSSTEEVFENELYDALAFSLDGEEIEVLQQNIYFFDTNYSKIIEIKRPKTYNCNILFKYENNDYLVKNVAIFISKNILDVSVELSGETFLTIKEGEMYTPRVVYSGFLGSDTVNNSLTYPATIPNEPKRPINNYEIRANGASSDYYEMNYLSSYITITSNPLEEITYTSAGEDLLIIRGNYSPYSELEFINVGVSDASVIFTEMNNLMDKFYASSGIFDNYKPIASYRINLSVDGEKEEDAISSISIKMDNSLKGYSSYFVIAFTNDGVYQVVNATSADGYLSFYTGDLGDFVVLAPIKGINTTQFLIIAFSIFGGLALCIIMFTVFRKKY